jgi:hypothetical protein
MTSRRGAPASAMTTAESCCATAGTDRTAQTFAIVRTQPTIKTTQDYVIRVLDHRLSCDSPAGQASLGPTVSRDLGPNTAPVFKPDTRDGAWPARWW